MCCQKAESGICDQLANLDEIIKSNLSDVTNNHKKYKINSDTWRITLT